MGCCAVSVVIVEDRRGGGAVEADDGMMTRDRQCRTVCWSETQVIHGGDGQDRR